MANKYILNNILVSYKLGWNCQAVKNPIPKPNQFLLQNVILKSSVALFTKVFDDFFFTCKRAAEHLGQNVFINNKILLKILIINDRPTSLSADLTAH